MKTTPANSTQILDPTRARRGPITQYFNPNIGPTGTSGIIIDNDSTLGQASSICFSNRGTLPSVVKLSQNGRQCVSGWSAQQRLQ